MHADLNQMANAIQNLRSKLTYLKKTASDINKIKTIGFEKFQKDVKMFESNLSKLKEGSRKKIREESLKQFTLLEEVERIKKFTVGDTVGTNAHHELVDKRRKKIATFKGRTPISKNTYASKEIAEFNDFCTRNHGSTGGWSIRDHETFLKIRSKHEDSSNFFDLVTQAIPHVTEEAARDHENWYVKYEQLRSKKKEAIAKWKREKNISTHQFNNNKVLDKLFGNEMQLTGQVINNQSIKTNHCENPCEVEITDLTAFTNNNNKLPKKCYRVNNKDGLTTKTLKQRLNDYDGHPSSEPITIVTLHGQPEQHSNGEKFPNLHLNIYGAQKQDVRLVLKYQ
ncbi:coiled-coil domain-containing protein 112-like isoform X2 [Adelges cooleyi]|uniref:coiled-coil domain-containing protein 112-like isoform X2 n=1 Tax=Adelges cooleyi TaxID=133065 RepID=UPI0021805E43|nr:coiled-coil domain-containing protein 112-like isoform X2 [Adelges cooleyi]